MSNPEERFSIRIKQQRSGAWAGVSYHATKREALEQATRRHQDYVWAVFDGPKKVVDCRGWSGNVDFECGKAKPLPPEVYVADLEMVVDDIQNLFEKLKGECRVHGDKFTPVEEARWDGTFKAVRGVLMDALVPLLSNWKEGQPYSRIGEKWSRGSTNRGPSRSRGIMSNTIELTPAILCTLATGIDSLNDGDDGDCAAAMEAKKVLARAGYVVSGISGYRPATEATSGYIAGGTYVFVTAAGHWSKRVKPGSTLFLDEECAVPLRTV